MTQLRLPPPWLLDAAVTVMLTELAADVPALFVQVRL